MIEAYRQLEKLIPQDTSKINITLQALGIDDIQTFTHPEWDKTLDASRIIRRMDAYYYGLIINLLNSSPNLKPKDYSTEHPYCPNLENFLKNSIAIKQFSIRLSTILVPKLIESPDKLYVTYESINNIPILYKKIGEPTGIVLINNQLYSTSPQIAGEYNGKLIFDLSGKNCNQQNICILGRPVINLDKETIQNVSNLLTPAEN